MYPIIPSYNRLGHNRHFSIFGFRPPCWGQYAMFLCRFGPHPLPILGLLKRRFKDPPLAPVIL